MMMPIPLKVFACCHCAATYFPGRSLCAACGSADFVAVDGEQGWIEQWTELRQSLSQRDQQDQRDQHDQRQRSHPSHLQGLQGLQELGEHRNEPQVRHYLATVRTAAGPRVIAAMKEAGAAGMAVTLCHEGACLIARPVVSVPEPD